VTVEIVAIGPPTPLYNCYAYAAANQNIPLANQLGWVWSGNPSDGLPPDGAVIKTSAKDNPKYPNGLQSVFENNGWYPVARGSAQPHVPLTGLVVIYGNAAGYQHAALVTPSGVFAKMGELGTYEFSRVSQLTGGTFGQPAVWLAKKTALPTIQLFAPESGVYNGHPFEATATVAGFTGPAADSLEGVPVTLQYYAGHSATGTPLGGLQPAPAPILWSLLSRAAPITSAPVSRRPSPLACRSRC
jgi:hypothetical protein